MTEVSIKSAGFKMLNLKGVALTSGGDGVTVKGAYEAVESSEKAIMLVGLNLDGAEHRPFYPDVNIVNSKFQITWFGDIDSSEGTITLHIIDIDDDDVVTASMSTLTLS